MKFSKYELAEMGLESKKKLTPAEISKKYQLNNFIGLLNEVGTLTLSQEILQSTC